MPSFRSSNASPTSWARELSRRLKLLGVELTERTMRYYLMLLDGRGYTEVFGKEELRQALVSNKVGFVISKIETLSYLTTLDMATMVGEVILNISCFPRKNSGKP